MKRLCVLLLSLLATVGGLAAADHPHLLPLNADRQYPCNLVGQLLFASGGVEYVGSGSVVRPKGVLTAGHNVYDPVGGFSTNMHFNRGNYGAAVISVQKASHLYVLAGYQAAANTYGQDDVRTFAKDSAGLTFPLPLAGGAFLRTSTDAYLLWAGIFQIAVGYGAEGNHTGDYPLFVEPTQAYTSTSGSFYENTSVYFEGGMSGGPNLTYSPWVKQYVISGVIVSGATNPDAGGIHIIDAAVTSFIASYLK